MLTRAIIALAFFTPSLAVAQATADSAQPMRARMALSDGEMEELRQGMGMGMARPAEINGYPGPSHALDSAAELGLSVEQISALRVIKERMSAHARALGAEVVEQERAIVQLFAEGVVDEGKLNAATAKSAELRGRLRAVHLTAHLETKAVLSEEQVKQYAVLRGYADSADTEPAQAQPNLGGGPKMHHTGKP